MLKKIGDLCIDFKNVLISCLGTQATAHLQRTALIISFI